jgi:hypothetical protein
MEKLKEIIKESRPNISESSIKVYDSIIRNLYKKINKDKEFDINFFNTNYKQVIQFLKDKEPKNRKTTYSALVVISSKKPDVLKAYTDQMMEDSKQAETETIKQEKTDKQKDNWVSQADIKNKFEELELEAKPLIKKVIKDKKKLTTDEYQQFQNYLILGLYYLNEPRRLLDYTEMKIKNYDPEKDNYFDKSKFIFNTYKTAKYTGKQEVKVDAKLRYILGIRKLLDDNEYLLIDTQKKKLTPVKLNQRLNKIFGKKVGASLLRHSFISEFLKDMPALQKMTETANNMGHQVLEQLKYALKD